VHNLLAVARLAHVLLSDLLAPAVTVTTLRVNLLVHASTQLVEQHLSTRALASGAWRDRTSLATATFVINEKLVINNDSEFT